MSDPTPLQQLNEAIHAYAAAIDNEAGTVGACVLSYERSRVDSDGQARGYLPIVYSTHYAFGPVGSGATAIGLNRLTSRLIEDALTSDTGDDE